MTLKNPSLHVFTFYINNIVRNLSPINGETTNSKQLKKTRVPFSVFLENKSVKTWISAKLLTICFFFSKKKS